jgi:hypothetical protein
LTLLFRYCDREQVDLPKQENNLGWEEVSIASS